jgi:ribosomal protein L9
VSKIEAANGLTFYKQATDTDSLYDSISEGDIAQHIHVEHKVHLEKKHFSLENKIESLGEYTVAFTYEDIAQQFPVHVIRNEGQE